MDMESFRRSVACVLATLLLALAACEREDDEPVPRAGNPFDGFEPRVLGAAPPEWVAPAQRLTWWAGSVTIAGTRETIYVEDPQGDFHDAVGHSYRIHKLASKTGGSMGDNTAGHGFVQADIIARTRTHAILSYRYLVMDDVNVPPVLTAVSGGKVDLATGGGLWGQPVALGALRSQPGLKVLRGPYTLNRTRYASIVLAGDDAARVYDLASGVMLVERITGQGQIGWVKRNHVYYPAPPSTSGALMLHAGKRNLRLPWASGAMPAWVRTTRVLHYRGGRTTVMPGSGAMTIPSTSTIRRTELGDDYALYEGEWIQPPYGVLPRQVATIPYAVGPAMVGGYWLDPARIQGLRSGQVLDEDPIAGSTLRVTGVRTAPNGKSIVILSEAAQRYTAEWTYDRTQGVLLYVRLIHPAALQTTTSWMELERTE